MSFFSNLVNRDKCLEPGRIHLLYREAKTLGKPAAHEAAMGARGKNPNGFDAKKKTDASARKPTTKLFRGASNVHVDGPGAPPRPGGQKEHEKALEQVTRSLQKRRKFFGDVVTTKAIEDLDKLKLDMSHPGLEKALRPLFATQDLALEIHQRTERLLPLNTKAAKGNKGVTFQPEGNLDLPGSQSRARRTYGAFASALSKRTAGKHTRSQRRMAGKFEEYLKGHGATKTLKVSTLHQHFFGVGPQTLESMGKALESELAKRPRTSEVLKNIQCLCDDLIYGIPFFLHQMALVGDAMANKLPTPKGDQELNDSARMAGLGFLKMADQHLHPKSSTMVLHQQARKIKAQAGKALEELAAQQEPKPAAQTKLSVPRPPRQLLDSRQVALERSASDGKLQISQSRSDQSPHDLEHADSSSHAQIEPMALEQQQGVLNGPMTFEQQQDLLDKLFPDDFLGPIQAPVVSKSDESSGNKARARTTGSRPVRQERARPDVEQEIVADDLLRELDELLELPTGNVETPPLSAEARRQFDEIYGASPTTDEADVSSSLPTTPIRTPREPSMREPSGQAAEDEVLNREGRLPDVPESTNSQPAQVDPRPVAALPIRSQAESDHGISQQFDDQHLGQPAASSYAVANQPLSNDEWNELVNGLGKEELGLPAAAEKTAVADTDAHHATPETNLTAVVTRSRNLRALLTTLNEFEDSDVPAIRQAWDRLAKEIRAKQDLKLEYLTGEFARFPDPIVDHLDAWDAAIDGRASDSRIEELGRTGIEGIDLHLDRMYEVALIMQRQANEGQQLPEDFKNVLKKIADSLFSLRAVHRHPASQLMQVKSNYQKKLTELASKKPGAVETIVEIDLELDEALAEAAEKKKPKQMRRGWAAKLPRRPKTSSDSAGRPTPSEMKASPWCRWRPSSLPSLARFKTMAFKRMTL